MVIIGAEMDALQLAALLPKSLTSTAKVLDSSGAWLSRWSQAWRAAGVDYLRTPVTKHPGPQPGSFAAWIDAQDRAKVGWLVAGGELGGERGLKRDCETWRLGLPQRPGTAA